MIAQAVKIAVILDPDDGGLRTPAGERALQEVDRSFLITQESEGAGEIVVSLGIIGSQQGSAMGPFAGAVRLAKLCQYGGAQEERVGIVRPASNGLLDARHGATTGVACLLAPVKRRVALADQSQGHIFRFRPEE